MRPTNSRTWKWLALVLAVALVDVRSALAIDYLKLKEQATQPMGRLQAAVKEQTQESLGSGDDDSRPATTMDARMYAGGAANSTAVRHYAGTTFLFQGTREAASPAFRERLRTEFKDRKDDLSKQVMAAIGVNEDDTGNGQTVRLMFDMPKKNSATNLKATHVYDAAEARVPVVARRDAARRDNGVPGPVAAAAGPAAAQPGARRPDDAAPRAAAPVLVTPIGAESNGHTDSGKIAIPLPRNAVPAGAVGEVTVQMRDATGNPTGDPFAARIEQRPAAGGGRMAVLVLPISSEMSPNNVNFSVQGTVETRNARGQVATQNVSFTGQTATPANSNVTRLWGQGTIDTDKGVLSLGRGALTAGQGQPVFVRLELKDGTKIDVEGKRSGNSVTFNLTAQQKADVAQNLSNVYWSQKSDFSDGGSCQASPGLTAIQITPAPNAGAVARAPGGAQPNNGAGNGNGAPRANGGVQGGATLPQSAINVISAKGSLPAGAVVRADPEHANRFTIQMPGREVSRTFATQISGMIPATEYVPIRGGRALLKDAVGFVLRPNPRNDTTVEMEVDVEPGGQVTVRQFHVLGSNNNSRQLSLINNGGAQLEVNRNNVRPGAPIGAPVAAAPRVNPAYAPAVQRAFQPLQAALFNRDVRPDLNPNALNRGGIAGQFKSLLQTVRTEFRGIEMKGHALNAGYQRAVDTLKSANFNVDTGRFTKASNLDQLRAAWTILNSLHDENLKPGFR